MMAEILAWVFGIAFLLLASAVCLWVRKQAVELDNVFKTLKI